MKLLPFLEKKVGSASLPAESKSIKTNSDSAPSDLESAVKKLFKASSDKERAAAFKAAVDACKKQPKEK